MLPCNSAKPLFLFLILILLLCAAGPGVYAENAAVKTTGKGQEKIQVSAATLTVDSGAKYAEFTGNVRAVQGSTVITANSLKIFYKTGSDNKEKSASNEDSVEKIIAEGSVKIKFEDKVAESDQATYTTQDKVLVLTGSTSKITSGNDSITGSKITFYRADGRIKVESSKEKPVEAVLHSGEKGIE